MLDLEKVLDGVRYLWPAFSPRIPKLGKLGMERMERACVTRIEVGILVVGDGICDFNEGIKAVAAVALQYLEQLGGEAIGLGCVEVLGKITDHALRANAILDGAFGLALKWEGLEQSLTETMDGVDCRSVEALEGATQSLKVSTQ